MKYTFQSQPMEQDYPTFVSAVRAAVCGVFYGLTVVALIALYMGVVPQ